MTLDPTSLEKLKRICADLFQKHFSEAELQAIGRRIIRYIVASANYRDADGSFDEG